MLSGTIDTPSMKYVAGESADARAAAQQGGHASGRRPDRSGSDFIQAGLSPELAVTTNHDAIIVKK